MPEPGLEWDLGEISRAGETQATACPAGTSRAGLQILMTCGSVLTKGAQDPTPSMLPGPPLAYFPVGTATLRQGGGWLPGRAGALQPQLTELQGAPENAAQGFSPYEL